MTARHVFEDHVADVQLRVEASTLPELFAEAAKGLAELYFGDGARGEPGPSARVVVRAPDREGLLVEWLNELIYRAETTGKACVGVEVTHLTDGEIDAMVSEAAGDLRPAVKAATYHGVSVREVPAERGGGVEATVVLDA